MNKEQQIRELWSYLKIQVNEILILKFYNTETEADEYVLARMVNGRLSIHVEKNLPDFMPGDEFHILKHIGANGKCDIPTVQQLEREHYMDY